MKTSASLTRSILLCSILLPVGHCTLHFPLLLCTSPEDHVVPPSDSDHLASVWSGEVERVTLENSFHVATQDNDQGLIIERTLAFIERVTS